MFFISLIETSAYKKILDYFLEKCTNFAVRFPDDDLKSNADNPLLVYRDDFLCLENITVAAWANMENSIEISGALTGRVKNIFYCSLCKKGLWQYSLFCKNEELFQVSDFDVGVMNISQAELEKLIREHMILSSDLMQ